MQPMQENITLFQISVLIYKVRGICKAWMWPGWSWQEVYKKFDTFGLIDYSENNKDAQSSIY